MGNQAILPEAVGVNTEIQKLWLGGSQKKCREEKQGDQIREQKGNMKHKQEEQSQCVVCCWVGGWAVLPGML